MLCRMWWEFVTSLFYSTRKIRRESSHRSHLLSKITKSQNILSWKGFTNIIESNSLMNGSYGDWSLTLLSPCSICLFILRILVVLPIRLPFVFSNSTIWIAIFAILIITRSSKQARKRPESSAPQIHILIFRKCLPSANLISCRLSLFPLALCLL